MRAFEFLVSAALAMSLPAAALAETAGVPVLEKPEYRPGYVMAKFPSLLSDSTVQSVATSVGVSKDWFEPRDGWRRLKIEDGADPVQKAADLQKTGMVDAATAIKLGTVSAFPATPPNDPRYPDQWGFPDESVPGAWQTAGGGLSDGTHGIAIIDTGVDIDHPDLGQIGGANMTDDGGNRDDICTGIPGYPNGHGTMVAGIAAAFTNNNLNLAGVAYNAKIYSLRVSNNCSNWLPDDVHQALFWAIDHADKIWVVNMSLEAAALSENDYEYVLDAIDATWNAGIPVVVPTGNSGANPFYLVAPGSFGLVIRVGGYRLIPDAAHPGSYLTRRWCACFPSDEWDDLPRPQGSNWGNPGVHVVAFVQKCWDALCQNYAGVWGAKAGGGTGMAIGTSFAAPMVAGVAYLVKSRHPTWTPTQIRDRIINTATKRNSTLYSYQWYPYLCSGMSEALGCGVLNAAAAVQ